MPPGDAEILARWRSQRGGAAALATLTQLVGCRTTTVVAQACTRKDLGRLGRQLTTALSAAALDVPQLCVALTVLVQGAWHRQLPIAAQPGLKAVLPQPTAPVALRALAAWGGGFLGLTAVAPLLSEIAAEEGAVGHAAREALARLEAPPRSAR